MNVLIWCALGFLIWRACVTSWNLISWPFIPMDNAVMGPQLSILIPARDEASSLPGLITTLQALADDNLEVIVLNDFSSDGTEAILKETARSWKHFRYINGRDLPSGWLGKNWACHQLSQEATGDYLLFLDADIHDMHPQLPGAAIATLNAQSLGLLSIFPTQVMETWGEKAVVPIMHYLLLTLLPLSWIRQLPFPSMAAANGQFMLFDAQSYHRYRWHAVAKQEIVEDIAIMQSLKRAGLKGMTYLAGGNIRCRMYRSYREGIAGFGKNLLAGFGYSILVLAAFLTLSVGIWPFLVPYLTLNQGVLACALVLWMRFSLHKLAQEPLWLPLLLHPIHLVSLLAIAWNSLQRKVSGNNIWKGRNIHPKQA